MTFNIFKDSRALDFAHKFIIDERLSSLRKVVKVLLVTSKLNKVTQ